MLDTAESQSVPANQNPWYCLATVHGEYDGTLNQNIANRNRETWNRWIAAALSDEQRSELIAKGFSSSELRPLSDIEKSEFLQSFAKRTSLSPS